MAAHEGRLAGAGEIVLIPSDDHRAGQANLLRAKPLGGKIPRLRRVGMVTARRQVVPDVSAHRITGHAASFQISAGQQYAALRVAAHGGLTVPFYGSRIIILHRGNVCQSEHGVDIASRRPRSPNGDSGVKVATFDSRPGLVRGVARLGNSKR